MPRALIAGGLTIDRFTDGTRAPGGSVMHAGLAAASHGAELSFLTIAGGEPEALAGIRRLGELGSVATQSSPSTTTYRHDEADGRRVLVLEALSTPIAASDEPIPTGGVAILAPIADELPPAAVSAVRNAARPELTVLLIQGWLRRLAIGEPVHPLSMDEVPDDVWATFSRADVVVVSTEDLAEGPEDPFVQASALRERLGREPLLVVTLGTEGYVLDDPAADRVVASVPRRVVGGVPSVGAGDTFGAVLGLELAAGHAPPIAAEAATEAVIRLLESRA
jgi:sugar/nucleoside kinase (ribokinase family)